MKKKIVIIGHFGGKENFFDGQTVKTKILYEELKKRQYEIYKVDTYYKKKNPFKLIIQTINGVINYNDIFILLSGGGMRIYFPLLYLVTKIRHVKVYHDVIGGNLDLYVQKYPKYKKYLSSFFVNWVETSSMKTKLENFGLTNVDVLPNFKNLDNIKATDYQNPIYRFCTFSRVMKEKGIETAIDAIKRINSEEKKYICELDIYGEIDTKYIEDFENLRSEFGETIKYKGIIPFNKSVDILKDYYALLFPTFWEGEGFPGTILDAYASAIPVIATDWNYNQELIEHMNTGIIYPNTTMKNLYDAVLWSINNEELMYSMRKKCADEYLKYKPETVINKVEEMINKKNKLQ